MKIFVNRRIRRTPWGGGIHFVSGFCDFLESRGHRCTTSYDDDVDVILMIDPRADDGFGEVGDLIKYKKRLTSLGRTVKVVHRVNDSDVPRGTNFLVDLNIKANREVADQTVFISEWLRDHYVGKGFDRQSTVIRNGTNLKFFYPPSTPSPTEKIKVVTHHWSDNYNKGFDAYVELDKAIEGNDNIEFTYVGRYWKGYTPKNTKIIPPLYGKELGDELRKHNVYVTAARWEACGMHHIEAAACGLPIAYHKDGGGIVEVCKDHGVQFDSATDVLNAVTEVHRNRANLTRNINPGVFDSDDVFESYLKIML